MSKLKVKNTCTPYSQQMLKQFYCKGISREREFLVEVTVFGPSKMAANRSADVLKK